MDTLLNFQPFVFSSSTMPGKFVEGLPLVNFSDDSLLVSHGRVFGLVSCKFPEEYTVDYTGDVLPFFQESYYKNDCESVQERLVTTVNETVKFLEKKIDENNDLVDFSLIVGVVKESVLYVARFGYDTALRLYRNDTFGNLFEIENSNENKSIVSFSGYLQPGDVICLYNDPIESRLFPISLSELISLETSVRYSRFEQYFSEPYQSVLGSCIVGFYIDSAATLDVVTDRVDLVEVERNLFKEDVVEEEFLPKVTENLNRSKFISSEASIRGFSSKIITSIDRSKITQILRKCVAVFTKQRVFILGCMLLILFGGLVVAGKDYENEFKQEKQSAVISSELLPKIEEAYKQGLYYAELNPDRAKNYLNEAKRFISQFDSVTLQKSDIQKIISDVDSAYGAVTKTYMLGEIVPYFDLSTVNSGNNGDVFSLAGSSLLISDYLRNSVYRVGTETRSATAIIGPADLDGLVGADGDDSVTYAVSAEKGIVRTEGASSKVERMAEASSSWGELVDAQLFANNIYVLDKLNSQIWKHVFEGNGFGAARGYVSSDETVDLSDAVGFSIDGNVWIAKASGDIIKLYSGKRDPFILSGIDGGLSGVKAIYTSSELDNLYILDSSNTRVVVVSKKDGGYLSTYASSVFGDASDVLVDVKSKQIYVLAKQKIYRFEMREEVVIE